MSDSIEWSDDAAVKLKEIPFFVRPFARKKIETFAKDNSLSLITVEVYDRAKQMFNKKYN